MSLAFIPLSTNDLEAWAAGSSSPRDGFAVTPEMAAEFDIADVEDEDAEHTSLCIASLAALIEHGHRLVAVVDAGWRPDERAAEFGSVQVAPVPFSAVTALFTEGAEPGVRAAALDSLALPDLAAAWELDPVQDLLAAGDLLWHGPGEWQALLHSQ